MQTKTVAHIFQRKGRNNISISPDVTVLDALRMMSEKNIGSVIVMDGENYCGLVTERDYARKVVLLGKSSSDTPVSEIMLEYLPHVTLHHTLEECMGIMSAHNIRYLPVFEEDEFYGVVSVIDVVKEVLLSQQETIDQLHTYIHSGM